MKKRDTIDSQEALVCTMVLVAAADGAITDREIGVMSGLVQTLPVFENFTTEHLQHATSAAIGLLSEADGLAHGGKLIREALEPRLRETAYGRACEVIAADGVAAQESLRMLEFVRGELKLDNLLVAALERGVRARYQKAEKAG